MPQGQEQESIGARAVGEVRVIADGQRACAVLEDGRLGIWNLQTAGLESALLPTDGPSFGDAGVESPKHLVVASEALRILAWNRSLLCVWDLSAGAGVGSLPVREIRDAAITPDGKCVLYVDGPRITLWKPDEGDSLVLGTYDGDPPSHVAISPDGQRAVSSGGDREVHIWRLNLPLREQFLKGWRRLFGNTTFAPDTSYWPDAPGKPSIVAFSGPTEAIVATDDGSVFVLDISDEPPKLVEVEGMRLDDRHASGVSTILLHPERRLFMTSSYDGTAKAWDLDKRCSIAMLDDHGGNLERLSTSADRVLLHTRDGVLKIVSLRNGALMAAFQGDKQFISSDADADLQWVVALDQGGQIHFFHLEGAH